MSIKILFISVLYITLFASCKKQATTETVFSEATYRVTLTGKWRLPEFSIPANAHFTPVIGMLHNSSAHEFVPGAQASTSAENIAEDGNSFPMLSSIDSLITQKRVLSNFIMFFPSVTESISASFSSNSNYSLFSCMSMIAPSPDWFIGVHDLDLMPAGKWLTDTTINLYVYDAGTEDGDLFGQSNPATTPQKNILLLTPSTGSALANGNNNLAALATIRLQKQ